MEARVGAQRPRAERSASELAAALVAGVGVALIVVIVSLSAGVLIFAGPLAPFVSLGVTAGLMGGFVLGVVIALGSGHEMSIGGVQSLTAVVLASAIGSIAGTLTAPGHSSNMQQLLATVTAAIAVAGIASGACFYTAGVLNLGHLIRYVPYPVICGFLAGTGWQLIVGALVVLAGPVSSSSVPHWLAAGAGQIVPGLVEALLLVVMTRRVRHYLVMPGILLAAMAVFYLVLAVARIPFTSASGGGWLLGPFQAGSLLRLPDPSLVRYVDWAALAGQVGNLVVLVALSGIAVLLNVVSMETTLREDLDLDRELRVAGVGNLLAGALGGIGGYHVLSGMMLAKRTGARSRLVGLTCAALIGATLVWGASVLVYVPRFMLAGLLLSLGIGMLVDWGYAAWLRLSRGEFAIVVLITLATGIAGFFSGILLGMVAALALFAVQSSSVGAIKYVVSGASMRSNVDRPLAQLQALQAHGDVIEVVELQGFLFFGSVNALVEEINRRMEDPLRAHVRYLVLDFRRVIGADSSAAISIAKLRYQLRAHAATLIVTHLSETLARRVLAEAATENDNEPLVQLPDLDRGIEWCEERVLVEVDANSPAASATAQLESVLSGPIALDRLAPFCERLTLQAGETLVKQGDAANEMFVLVSGRVDTVLESPNGAPVVRLRTAGAGTLVGEMGVYRGMNRSASVLATEPTVVYRITVAAFDRMREQDPQLAIALHEFVAAVLAERVAQTTAEMAALLR